MKIIVKSDKENFIKEKSGKKPNTVRRIDGYDTIQVIDASSGESFERTISDWTLHDKRLIISWFPEPNPEGEKK